MNLFQTSVVALGTLSLLWGAVPAQAGPSGGATFLRADLDGDGDDDLLLRNAGNGELAYWILEDGAIVAGGGLGGIPASFEFRGAGKIDGDDIDDLVIYDSATDDVLIWFMAFDPVSNAVTVGSGATVGNTGGAEVKGVGQFNPGTDSVPDILLQGGDSTISVWYLNADGSFQGGGSFGTPGAGWDALTPADLDGDGNSDLVLRNNGLGQLGFWETSDGALGVNRGSGFNLDASFTVLGAAADFNGDGIDDLALQDAGGNVFVWLLFSDPATPPTIDTSVDVGAAGANKLEAPGNFNTGDTDVDVILSEESGGNRNISTWFLSDGAFAGGGFIGAPPLAYEVSNAGAN